MIEVKRTLSLTLLFLIVLLSKNSWAQKLVIATESWEDYSGNDANGVYEAIIEQTYGQDFIIEYVYVDYVRSKALVKSGKADMYLGSYDDEENYALYPDEAMDADNVHALFIPDPNNKDWLPEFKNARAAWMNGYLYDVYFPQHKLTGYEVHEFSAAIALLEEKRIDFILGDQSSMLNRLRALKSPTSAYQTETFGQLFIFPGFAKTERAQELIALWDSRLKQMKQDGTLFKIFRDRGVDFDYPF